MARVLPCRWRCSLWSRAHGVPEQLGTGEGLQMDPAQDLSLMTSKMSPREAEHLTCRPAYWPHGSWLPGFPSGRSCSEIPHERPQLACLAALNTNSTVSQTPSVSLLASQVTVVTAHLPPTGSFWRGSHSEAWGVTHGGTLVPGCHSSPSSPFRFRCPDAAPGGHVTLDKASALGAGPGSSARLT